MRKVSNAGALLVIASGFATGCGGITSSDEMPGGQLIRAEDIPVASGAADGSAGESAASASRVGPGRSELISSDGQSHDLASLGPLHEVLLGAPPTCSERFDCGTGDYYVSIAGELGEHTMRHPFDDAIACLSSASIAPWYAGTRSVTGACSGPNDEPPCILVVQKSDGLDAVELIGRSGAAWRLVSGTVERGSLNLDDREVARAELSVVLRDRWTGVDSAVTVRVQACRGQEP